jgi:hypothetical protein
MSRFFFDIVARQTRRYDFHGQFLVNRAQAEQVAEMVVLDCTVSDDEDWTGGEVQVRDEDGSCILSVPIRLVDASLAA